MKSRRLRQFILSISIVLSLFVSSIAACVCSHHGRVITENHQSSCHQMTMPDEENSSHISDFDRAAKIDAGCNCFAKTASPFVVSKFDNIKTQKTPAILSVAVNADNFNAALKIVPAKFIHQYHFYNSNYLERLTPARAPPVS